MMSGGTARSRQSVALARWALAGLGALASLVGCTAFEAGATRDSVVIPLGAAPQLGGSQAVHDYYRTVFARMRDAAGSGTADGLRELRFLILQHKRDGMVESARQRMEQFELLADGLTFELGLPQRCAVKCVTVEPRAHEPQRYEFTLSAPSSGPALRLGDDEGHPVTFQVVAKVRDFDSMGQFIEIEDTVALRLPERDRVVKGRVTLPFELPGARPQTVIRELMISVEMLPGVVLIGDRQIPVGLVGRKRRTRTEVARLSSTQRLKRGTAGYTQCCSFSMLLYPTGFESIKKAPLTTLTTALRRGEPKLFRHIFLAAHFMPDDDRERALMPLIHTVRVGKPTQAQVAMGALRVLAREDLPITERREWLQWWQRRNAADWKKK